MYALKEEFRYKIHGMQRFSTLLFQNTEKNLEELSDYELSNHIQNPYRKLPHHTPKDFKKSLKEVI